MEVFHAGRCYQVLASANPRSARIHLVSEKPTRGVEQDTPLLLLLRKYVRNGVVTAIEQPDLERIVALSITKYPTGRKESDPDDEVDAERRCELVVELLGQRANLMLVDDDNLILEAVKRIPGDGNSRAIVPRTAYTLPPRPAGRLDPRTAAAGGVHEALTREGDPAKALAAVYAGVSPLLAREALARAGVSVATAAQGLEAAVAEHLRALYTEPFAPSLAYEEDEPVAVAPYRLTQYADVRPVDSISAALQTFYEAAERLTAHAQRRDRLAARIDELRTRYGRQKEALGRELARAEALDTLRWEGEMIFGWMHALEPGQTELEVEGKRIKLDPKLTPVENAQARFREYDKAKGALAGVPERLQETSNQLAYLDEVRAMLDLAESFEEIATIEREMAEQGLLGSTAGRAKGPRGAPLRVRSSDGATIVVGRSAGQNEEVTFKEARPDDLWFHARDVPGAHVIVRVEGPVGDATLEEAAGLAAYFSRARGSTSVEVSVCRRRDVRKVPGGPPGLVTIRNERSLRVPPLGPREVGRRA
jgi:predicted ribosome quality control (RQC) complex YloA/Tae2 family protein